MKRIALALLAAAGLTATAARADRVDIRGSINLGGPAYAPTYTAPGYYVPAYPARGYWREVTVPVLIPGRWITRHDAWGRHIRIWEPAHNEYRRERVWVEAGREHYRGYERGHDYDRGNGYGPRWNG